MDAGKERVLTEPETKGAAAASGSAGEPRPDEDELLELLRRERASFLNYKRRVEQERARDRQQAQGEVLLRLVPILDDLDRALGQRPAELERHPWVEGVALIKRRLDEALCDLGVERVGTEGEPFDPARHEAVLYEGRAGSAERRVEAILRPGYQLHERLLRPAQVRVVGPPEEDEAQPALAERKRRSKSRRGEPQA